LDRPLAALLAALASCGYAVPSLAADAPTPRLAIEAEHVYMGDGRSFQNGTILIQHGRITEVGPDVAVPKDAQAIDLEGASVTPGLIDANARLENVDMIPVSRKVTEDGHMPFASGVGPTAVMSEQSSEVVPNIRILDGLNLRSRDFSRLVRGGVTAVYASPDAAAVLGPRGAVLRTGGPEDGRVLVPEAAVKATIGSEPSSLGTYNRSPSRTSTTMYTRRPNSRMGLTWVFRKAFYDALRRRDGQEAYGADTSSPEASAVLLDVLENKVPLRIQARIQQDILTALRLAEEFDLEFTLEEATEAYECIDELKERSVPVIFGPIYERPTGLRARTYEARRSRYFTFRALIEAGIPTALSAQELREEDGLARQAMYAMRFGVGFDDVLRAVTQTPARLLGLEAELGTLESGKRADLVAWSGPPFAATSEIIMVLIDGQIAYDRR
jgi:imidazolonepropionase-like amidohydrolase